MGSCRYPDLSTLWSGVRTPLFATRSPKFCIVLVQMRKFWGFRRGPINEPIYKQRICLFLKLDACMHVCIVSALSKHERSIDALVKLESSRPVTFQIKVTSMSYTSKVSCTNLIDVSKRMLWAAHYAYGERLFYAIRHCWLDGGQNFSPELCTYLHDGFHVFYRP
jgi:hypothetical protein